MAPNTRFLTVPDPTCGEAADAPQFETLLDIGRDIQPRAAIPDKRYANKANRAAARARGVPRYRRDS